MNPYFEVLNEVLKILTFQDNRERTTRRPLPTDREFDPMSRRLDAARGAGADSHR